ncbi:2-phospho-L-lactate guanylyltransferase [Actinomycetospora termitidis]|uniref:Phosphoenolpyruvate guanylyltransferase n=1 Tax=Actinomycetospora termitidis TaxID=3053470 RepID=A0ABT7M5H0_9PSEU|nr:2-phospho-L-lactate guanylyltransferase [Actinomycetospora sp. Odt1-22]MDL5155919.1 2-phospho-L-lactate guanylyltransferase [Actinomycetospora sp. Odt1-22]
MTEPGVTDLVVPVKELRRAKTRLAAASAVVASTARGRRAAHDDLAFALAADTLAAVLASSVRRLALVTSEPRVAGPLAPHPVVGNDPRVDLVADPGRGLNAAIRAGIERWGGSAPVGVLLADLPALRAAELDDALAAARAALRRAPAAFVADHTGEGTSLLVLAPGFTPRFGPGSAAAHAAAGAVALTGDWPGLRHDVDVPSDLDEVRALGVGPATRAWPEVPALAGGCR